ncbi:hypothetical protein C8J57DRAFT_1211605 [Mycena rebaudengoi]|nr:hypothetical protein C8J57DRAFT_1211605 [Mycena rebaudengoi]
MYSIASLRANWANGPVVRCRRRFTASTACISRSPLHLTVFTALDPDRGASREKCCLRDGLIMGVPLQFLTEFLHHYLLFYGVQWEEFLQRWYYCGLTLHKCDLSRPDTGWQRQPWEVAVLKLINSWCYAWSPIRIHPAGARVRMILLPRPLVKRNLLKVAVPFVFGFLRGKKQCNALVGKFYLFKLGNLLKIAVRSHRGWIGNATMGDFERMGVADVELRLSMSSPWEKYYCPYARARWQGEMILIGDHSVNINN